MKTLASILFTLAIITSSAMAQDVPSDGLPNEVRNAFVRDFNNPAGVEWERRNNYYEVDFDLANVGHAARYSPTGELLMIKMELDEQDLPPVIIQRINDDFREFRIDDIHQIKTGDRIFFQVALDGPSSDRKMVFTADGEINREFQYWN